MARIDYQLELDTVITNALIGVCQNTKGAIREIGIKKVEKYYNYVASNLEQEYNYRIIAAEGNNRMFKLSIMHDEFFEYKNVSSEDFLVLKSGADINKIKTIYTNKLPWQVRVCLQKEDAIQLLINREGEFIPVEKK